MREGRAFPPPTDLRHKFLVASGLVLVLALRATRAGRRVDVTPVLLIESADRSGRAFRVIEKNGLRRACNAPDAREVRRHSWHARCGEHARQNGELR